LCARAFRPDLERGRHQEQMRVVKPSGRWLVHRLIPLVAVGLLIAAHGSILYYVSSHATVSLAVAAVILVAIKHLGLLFAWFRRRRPPCVE
jgi:membrane protein YdbS with pleckstrin-like domain